MAPLCSMQGTQDAPTHAQLRSDAAVGEHIQRTLGASGLEQLAGLLDGGLGASDHGLLGVVEVHGFDGLVRGGGGFGATGLDAFGIHAEDGSHATSTHRHGFLHGLGTETHQGERVLERQGASGHQGCVLTQ